jgi:hypothetical protein
MDPNPVAEMVRVDLSQAIKLRCQLQRTRYPKAWSDPNKAPIFAVFRIHSVPIGNEPRCKYRLFWELWV